VAFGSLWTSTEEPGLVTRISLDAFED
jgi:hypothetical protein